MLPCRTTRQREPPPRLACRSVRGVIAVGRRERELGHRRRGIAEGRRDRARRARARRHLPGVPARSHGGVHRISPALGAAAMIAVVAMASLPPAPSAAVPRRALRRPSPPRSSTPFAPGTPSPRRSRSRSMPRWTPRPSPERSGSRPTAPSASRGTRAGTAADDRADMPAGSPTPCTRSRSTRSARSEAGGRLATAVHALVLTTGRGPRLDRRDASAQGVASAPTRRSRSSSTGPSRSPPSARRCATEPALDGDARAGGDRRRVPVHPVGAASPPQRPTACRSTGLVRRRRRAVRDPTPCRRSRPSKAPSVVRFRPFDGTARVDRGAILSVRFTRVDGPATRPRGRSR